MKWSVLSFETGSYRDAGEFPLAPLNKRGRGEEAKLPLIPLSQRGIPVRKPILLQASSLEKGRMREIT